MKIDIQKLDDNALPEDSKGPFPLIRELKEVIKRNNEMKNKEEPEIDMKDSSNDEDFYKIVKKLVDQKLWRVQKFPFSAIIDIFNAIVEKLEKWKEITDRTKLQSLLHLVSMISTKTNFDNIRPENVKCIIEIIQSSEDLEIIHAGLEVIVNLNQKRIIELSDRIAALALGPNVLKKEQDFESLYQTEQNKSLIESDLQFEYEIEPQGLNDRQTTKTAIISRQNILNDMSASELAQKIASEYGKENDSQFKLGLEIKLIWCRYINSQKQLRHALKCQIFSIYVAVSMKQDGSKNLYFTYLKDKFMQESKEYIMKSNDKLQKIQVILLQTINKILSREHYQGLVNFDTLIQPEPQVDQERTEPFIVQLLSDLCTVHLTKNENGILVQRSDPKYINQLSINYPEFQFQVAFLVTNVIRIYHVLQGRGTTHQELIIQLANLMLKIIDDIPVENTYCFNLKIPIQFSTILRQVLRPRVEEQLNLVNRFEQKLLFEVENLETKFFYFEEEEKQSEEVDFKDRAQIIRQILTLLSELVSRDVNALGIGRKVLDSKLLTKLQSLLAFNNDEQGHKIDDFISKYFALIGAICSDQPAQIPTLIRNGLITPIIESLEKRLPSSFDIIASCLYILNQITLNNDGQELVTKSSIFKKLLFATIDPKLSKIVINNLNSESHFIKMYLCNFYDRNAGQYINQTKDILLEILQKITEFATNLNGQYYLLKKSNKEQSEKQKEIDKLKDNVQYSQLSGGIFLFNLMSFLSNDRMNQSRHTADIITVEVFGQILKLFEIISYNPTLSPLLLTMMKTFRNIIDNVYFIPNMDLYIQNFKKYIADLSLVIGNKLDLQKFGEKIKDLKNKQIKQEQQDILIKEIQLSEYDMFQIRLYQVSAYLKTFLGLSSQTKQGIISSADLSKEIKILFRFGQALCYYKNDKIEQIIANLEQDKESEIYKKFELLIITQANATQEQKTEQQKKAKEFFSTFIEDQINKELGFNYQDLQISEFLGKIWNYSISQQRHQRQRDNQKKIITLFGKQLYKITKEFSSKKLNVNESQDNIQYLKKLYMIEQDLSELVFSNTRSWFDGQSFYEFYKKGGLHNIFNAFRWLSTLQSKITNDTKYYLAYLFDEAVSKCADLLIAIETMRNLDHSQSAFIEINMMNQYDTPRHFFSNVFYSLCANLLPIEDISNNPLLALYNERNNKLQESVIQLLQQVAKNFSQCVYLRDGGAKEKKIDQAAVQMLMEMGFPRNNVMQALQQFQNVDQASNFLLEQQLNNPSIFNQQQEQMFDIKSVESENNNMNKVSVETFQNTMKQIQSVGFKWVLEAQQLGKINKAKSQEYLYNTMINEKDEKVKKDMFLNVFESLKKSIQELAQFLNHKEKSSFEDDVQMQISTEGQDEKSKMEQLSCELQLLQKVVTKNKRYIKESVRMNLFKGCSELLLGLIHKINSSEIDESLEKIIQVLIFDLLFVLFTMLSFVQLSKKIYKQENAKLDQSKEENKRVMEEIQRKLKEYFNFDYHQQIFVPSLELLICYTKQLEKSEQKFMFKRQTVEIAISIIFKVLLDEDLTNEQRSKMINESFDIITKVKTSQGIDSKIMTSLTLLGFEDQKLNYQLFEKLITRALHLKYEEQLKITKKQHLEQPENLNNLTQTNYVQFLNYFKLLSVKDKESFSQCLANMCEIKATKKQNKIIQESALIKMKESTFQDLHKQILKERQMLKQIVKQVDLKNDKQISSQIKTCKKALLQSLTQEQQSSLSQMISIMKEKTSSQINDFMTYIDLQSQSAKYIVAKNEINKMDEWSLMDESKLMELLSKMMLAYPSTLMTLIPSQPNKRSFVNWFIQDFVVSQIIKKSPKEQVDQEDKDKINLNISYDLKSNLKSVDEQIFKILNNMTGYNYLMTMNEQVVKHELRQKFIIESLSILQKIIKNKAQQSPLKLRTMIISCLMVINSLVDFKNALVSKQMTVSKDNFYNSIRTLIVRDGQLNNCFPHSFIKTVNELLSDVIDLNQKANSEIIKKSISIVKVIAEFINTKKKENKKEEHKEEGKEEQKQPEDAVMDSEEEQEQMIIDENEQIDDGLEDEGDDDDLQDEEEQDEEDNMMEDEDENEEIDELEQEAEDEEEDEEDIEDELMPRDEIMVEELESDEDDLVIEERIGGERRPNQDIVNVNERDVIQILGNQGRRPFMGMDYGARGDMVPARQGDWSQEEQEVQRILLNLRGLTQQLEQHVRDDQLARPFRNRNDAVIVKQNIVEQMFDGLKLIQDQELFDIVIKLKQTLDAEYSEKKPTDIIAQDYPIQPMLNRHDVPVRILEALERNELNRRALIGDDDLFHGVLNDFQFILGNPLGHQLRDPMYQRPPPGIGMGQQQDINQQPVVELGSLQSMINRQQQTSQQENLGESLLERMQVEVEPQKEEKKEEAKQESPAENQMFNLLQEELQRQEQAGRQQSETIERQREEMLRQQEQLMRQHQVFQESLGQVQQLLQQQEQISSPRIEGSIQAQQVSEEQVQQQQIPQQQEQQVQEEEKKAEQNQAQSEQAMEEEKKDENKEEQKDESQKQEEEKKEGDSGKTFGYDNDFLRLHDIDPEILVELPEELRMELLSTLQVQPQPSQQNQQEQRPQAQEEEKKEGEQQPAQQQQNQPEYAQLAQELGLDAEFLASIPEEFRRELIQNEQLRYRNLGVPQPQQQPQREAEQMDVASFIATVTDPRLRQEIFASMDEAALATLPPNLLAEARRGERRPMHFGFARQNEAIRQQHERLGRNELEEIFGGRRILDEGWGGFPPLGGQALGQPGADILIDQAISKRQSELAEEMDVEDCIQAATYQFSGEEKILEALIYILCGNENVECELIPTLQAMIKLQATNGLYIIRNKIINALTYLLRILALNDQEQIKIMLPNTQVKRIKTLLTIIGTLRILLKSNKKLVKQILKSLFNKDEYFKTQGNHTLKKQQKSMQTALNPPLSEIIALVKTDTFKTNTVLMKNLSILIQQILKQFDIVIQELGAQSHQISKETVESLSEILLLDMIDSNLLQDLGNFLYQISKSKKQNYELISEFCENKSCSLLNSINMKLEDINIQYEQVKRRYSPAKGQNASLEIGNSPSYSSLMEEEKSELMIINTVSSGVESKVSQYKLSEEEEKQLKQQMKMSSESEPLLRIFKLFNLFFEKFNQPEEEKLEEGKEPLDRKQITERIANYYDTKDITHFIQLMNEVLRIVQNANIEVTDSISNLIFCAFSTFFPEVYLQFKKEEEKHEEVEEGKEKDQEKHKIKMTNIQETLQKVQVDKFNLFKNTIKLTPKLEQLNQFCYRNRRVINKLIKTKQQHFVQEMDTLIKQMPNLLDFENKRGYFKAEINKLKRNQYYDQIQLQIRRDNIFMDSYEQFGREAGDMKGRLHVQFIGERGQDAGGLTREFFIELSREMFNPNYSLFNLSSSGSTYYPNPKSLFERDHLKYFKFIGRVIGKALFDECLLECYFVKSFYKIMTGEPLNFYDLEDFDNEFFNNLKWCLENDVESLCATFSIEQDFFGKVEEIELIPGGKKIAVTNENKLQYVEKLTYFKLYYNIRQQIDAFLEGFYELIPKELVSIFNYKELELLISGLPNFDINDLKQNTEYQGYNANSPQVLWLWEILEQFENSERAEFLQFVTGSSKVPLDGFKGLMGMRGPQKFTIAKVITEDIQRLPSGHTCFNQIDIPEYPAKEIMHERLLTAIKETKGFGFA